MKRLPGIVAIGLITLTTALWTFWGVAEMYYEGWGNPFPLPLAYLIPGAVCLTLTLITLTWPRGGGWLLVILGGAFTAWWWGMQARRAGGLSFKGILSMFPVSGLIVFTGVLFIIEGQRQRQARIEGVAMHPRWWRRNLRYLIGVGIPLLVVVGVSVAQLPIVLSRVDDGDRGAREIAGNGITLVWAPAGPGWNWQQAGGWHPSWDHIAFYGVPPLGLKLMTGHATQGDMDATNLCRYLGADGLTLLDEPQGIWRMPTTDEVVRSLVRHGENAGCAWNGQAGSADCRVRPDKETPLWAPDRPPIYYWTADEYDERDAWYVSYNGMIDHQPKDWANPRHGYRCVREP